MAAEPSALFAAPRIVDRIEDCYFYHITQLPGMTKEVGGEWDLRNGVDDYLGHVNFTDKKVLEIGPGSGFLTFEMEKRGAAVTCIDLSEKHDWDIVPMGAHQDNQTDNENRRAHIHSMNNGFWYAHRLHQSKAQVIYSQVYDITPALGYYDVALLGSVLLHLRDPFLALQNTLNLTRERAIITDLVPNPPVTSFKQIAKRLLGKAGSSRVPYMQFMPDYATGANALWWWMISPEAMLQMLGVLGFEKNTVTFHEQKYRRGMRSLYTVVGERTRPIRT